MLFNLQDFKDAFMTQLHWESPKNSHGMYHVIFPKLENDCSVLIEHHLRPVEGKFGKCWAAQHFPPTPWPRSAWQPPSYAVTRSSTFLDSTCKWGHTAFVFLCLTSLNVMSSRSSVLSHGADFLLSRGWIIFHYMFLYHIFVGSPSGAVAKNLSAAPGASRRHSFDPWIGKTPWRRKCQPVSVFLLGKSHNQRSLTGYNPRVHKELEVTEWLNTHIFICWQKLRLFTDVGTCE